MFSRLMKSKRIRTRTSLIVALLLIGPFVFFFHAYITTPTPTGPGGMAGKLFGANIPWDAYQVHLEWLRRRWLNQLNDLPVGLEPLIRRQAWQRLMILEEAKRQRLRVSDEALAERIRQDPTFQQDARFRPDRYHRYLRFIGMTPQTFEAMARDDLLIEQVVDAVRGQVTVTEEDVREAYRNEHERLTVALLIFEASTMTDQVREAITDEDLRDRYDAQPEDLRIPEQLVIESAGMPTDELTEALTPTDEELGAVYEEESDRWTDEAGVTRPFEEVKDDVRQELLDERLRARLNTLVLDLEDDLTQGFRFEEIVVARALTGITVGPVRLDAPSAPGLEPAVWQAVTDLEEGGMSGVIETEDAVWIARVAERIPSRIPSFEEAREQIRATLIRERSESGARAQADAAREHLVQRQAQGWRFEEAIRSLDVQVLRPAPFARDAPIDLVGSAPQVNAAAFATPLGGLTEVLQADSRFVLLRPEELLPADDSGFTPEEQERLREGVLARKRLDEVSEWLAGVEERANLQSFVDSPPPSEPLSE